MLPAAESKTCLIVFAKTPLRGSVKTRMQPELSEEDCLQLHSLLLRLWMERLHDWDLGLVHKTIFFTPFGSDRADPAVMLDLPEGVCVETQQGQDLGARLSHTLYQKWNNGFRKLVFIGTDSPLVGIEDLQAGFQALDQNEIVLGPTTDGGYYLIGFSALLPFLFSGIPWGSSQVFNKTVQLMERHSIRWHCLRETFDLDCYEDLLNFHRLLQNSPSGLSSSTGQDLVSLVERLFKASGILKWL